MADRGANSCLPPTPLKIRLDDANGPTNSRAGGIRVVEGKARTDFYPYPSFALSSRTWVLLSSAWIILTTHPRDASMFLLQTDGVAGARG